VKKVNVSTLMKISYTGSQNIFAKVGIAKPSFISDDIKIGGTVRIVGALGMEMF